MTSEIGERATIVPQPFAGEAKSETNGTAGGKVEWAVWWPGDEEGFVRSYCNTVPTAEGGTHESGFRSALVRGLKRYAELTGNRKGSIITADDVIEGAAALVSVFIEQPQFQGQTKEKLVSVEATKLVETIVGDNFEHWLTGDKEAGNVLLEHVVAKAEERLRRRQDREQQRKTATRKLRLPGKLADCSNSSAEGTEIFLVEGDSAGGSAKAARNRETQAILPLRGKILNVASATRRQAAREPGDPGPHPGAGLRHGRPLQRRPAALRAGHHHDRRRRRRRPHRLAADDVLLSRDAEDDRERPSLPRPAAALPHQPGRQDRICPRRQAQGRADPRRVRRRKVEITRFKGLGEMQSVHLRETTMDLSKRTLLKVDVPHAPDTEARRQAMERRTLVENLMGRKPEKRYAFIQEHAKFARDLDV